MDMDLFSLICFLCVLPLGILLFFGMVIGILYHDRQKHASAWREIARQAGLTFHPPGWFLGRPTLSGAWHNRPVRAYTITRGTSYSGGATTTMYIEMTVQLPANTRLQISERNLFSQLLQAGAELPTSDPEFDQRFVVRGEPPEFIRHLLSASSLRRLLLYAPYLNIQTSNSCMTYKQLNVETDPKQMLALFALMFDLAEAIERI